VTLVVPAWAAVEQSNGALAGDYRLLLGATPNPASTNGVVTYTVTETSEGPGTVDAPRVRLEAPASTRFANFGAPEGWTCSTPDLDAPGPVDCSAESLPPGSAFFVAAYRIDDGVVGGTRISAVAELSAETLDPVPGNNRVEFDTDVLSPALISLTKTAPAEAVAGEPFRYRLRLSNRSTSSQADLAGDEMIHALPAPLIPVAATASSGAVLIDSASRQVRWNGRIAAASSVSVDIDVLVPAATAAGTVVESQAQAFFDADGDGVNETTVQSDDPDLPGAADPTATTIGTSADVSLLLATTSAQATVGRVIDFEVAVLNAGPSTARNVTLSSAVPEGSVLVEFTAPPAWICNTPAPGASGAIACQRPALPEGRASFRIAVRVDSDTQANRVELAARVESDTPDPDADNGSDLLQVPLKSGVRLLLLKAVSGNHTPGGVARYALTLSNVGTLPQFDNPGPELVDAMPPELRIIASQASQGRLVVTGGGSGLEWNGALAPGESATLQIEARIDPETPVGSVIENRANAHADVDGDGVNEVTVPSIDPSTGLDVGPTVFGVIDPAVADPRVVPAGSPVTTALLVTLLAMIGSAMLRRRSRSHAGNT
jgi:uncharacterized repeat protein (TIGR01451 family)